MVASRGKGEYFVFSISFPAGRRSAEKSSVLLLNSSG